MTTKDDPDLESESFDRGLDDCIKNILHILDEETSVFSPGLIVKATSGENNEENIYAYFFPDLVPALRDTDKEGANSPKLPQILGMFRSQTDRAKAEIRQAWFAQETTALKDDALRYSQHLWPYNTYAGAVTRIIQIDGRDILSRRNQALLFLDTRRLSSRLDITSVKRTYSEQMIDLEEKDHVLDILFD